MAASELAEPVAKRTAGVVLIAGLIALAACSRIAREARWVSVEGISKSTSPRTLRLSANCKKERRRYLAGEV